MVKIEENKFYTEHKKIEVLAAAPIVYIPLSQHLGKICDCLQVKIGDTVPKGQLLSTAQAQPFAPIHASVSGKIAAIQSWPHPTLGACKAIVIENDGKDSAAPEFGKNLSPEAAGKLTPEQIRESIFRAGVIGMGGAAFPTHIKLNPPKPVHCLLINIAECEPYLTNDSQLVAEKAPEIIAGIELEARCFPLQKIYISIEDNTPEAIAVLTKELAQRSWKINGIEAEMAVLKSQYPQGGEKQLVQKILKTEVPRGKLPFDVGVTVQNVGTVYAIYEAVYKNKPLIERVVTVTGGCLTTPKNLLARIGTPVKYLIDACGPLKETPVKIIAGGPMMGIAQFTDQIPVIKSTTGIILLGKREARRAEELPCIRCGACIRECPMGATPALINQASNKSFWAEAKTYGALDCIECGLCNFVCPSNRRIVQSIKRVKLEAPR